MKSNPKHVLVLWVHPQVPPAECFGAAEQLPGAKLPSLQNCRVFVSVAMAVPDGRAGGASLNPAPGHTPSCCLRACSTQNDLGGNSCPFASSSKMLQHLKDASVLFPISA